MSEIFDWSVLISHYNEAHDLALGRKSGKIGRLDIKLV
jgi:hypothetical protein